MKYTITRALSELKLLKDRYCKEVSQVSLIAVKHGSKLRSPYSAYKEEDFKTSAKSEYQSICDLEKRITEIKNKIDVSNFTTVVSVGGKEMTIQEVLNYKNTVLDLKRSRLAILKEQKTKAQYEYDKAITENKLKVEKISADKNASGSMKSSGEIEQDALDFVEKAYAVSMVDPIQIDNEIKELDEEIRYTDSRV